MDMNGRTIYTNSFNAGVEGAELLELPDVAPGMYLIRITRNGDEPLGTEKLEIRK